MNTKQGWIHKCKMFCLLLTLVAFSVTLAQADPIPVVVNVNTAGIAGTNGFLNFQFNPGGATAQSATATITGFSQVGGSLAATATRIGASTGTLPGTVALNNSTQLNDLFQGDQFGSSFSFTVTLSGPAIDAPSNSSIFGSTFALFLYGANNTPLLTTDPDGSLLRLNINPNGSLSVVNFNASAVQSQVIPEPATLILLGSGLAGVVGIARRRRNSKD